MFKNILYITSIVLYSLLASQTFAQQVKVDSELNFIDTKYKILHEYSQDLIDYSKSYVGDNLEYEISGSFQQIVSTTSDYLDASYSFFLIYSKISNKNDRITIKPIIQKQFQNYVYQIKIFVNEINNGLSHTKKSALSVSGDNLKKQIRELISFYDNYQFLLQ